jgi:DNA-binding NarL/FixJ family response regulator
MPLNFCGWWRRSIVFGRPTICSTRANVGPAAPLNARHQGDYPRAQGWFEQALAAWQTSGDQHAYASTLCELGEVAFRLGEYAQAERYFSQSRELDLGTVSIDALNGLGRAIWMLGDPKQAEALQQEALNRSQSCTYIRGTAWALNALGEIARAKQEWQAAERYFQASASSFQQIGDQGAERMVQQNLAFVLLAHVLLVNALHQWRIGGALHAMALSLAGLAGVCSQQDQHELAARLIGAAQQRLSQTKTALEQSDRADYQRIVEAVERQLGRAHFRACTALGQHSDLDELLKEIRSSEVHQLPEPSKSNFGLTAREFEVLQLLAEGLTNAQIAEQLTISPYTVNIHIRSIFGKLGVTTRAAATRRALESHLVP